MADYLDNFVDPNGTLVENHTADTGQKYSSGSQFKIQNNRLYGDLPNATYFTDLLESDGVTRYTSDQQFDLEFDYRLLADKGNLGIFFCATDTSNAYYVFVLEGGSLDIRTIVSGSSTTLHSEPVSTTASSTGSVKIEVRDTTIEMFLDGASVFSGTNTDHERSGEVYFRTSEPSGPTSGWAFDRVSLTSTVPSSTPTITDIDGDESIYPGQSFVTTGTNFGATQGTGTVDIDGVAQTVTAWSDTSITCTAVRGGNEYGTGKTLTVTTDAGTTATFTVAQEAEPGTFAVTAASPNTTDDASLWSGLVDTATGDPVTVVDGDQAWVNTLLDGLAIS